MAVRKSRLGTEESGGGSYGAFSEAKHYGTSRSWAGTGRRKLSLSMYTLKNRTDLWDYWPLRLVPEIKAA